MAIGTSPYNFVPLNEHIYFPEWADQISMDIPFEDGEDGIIEVEWVNDSPLFTRDTKNANDKNAPENQFSMHIMQPDGTRRYFLPGSSQRGMLRNVLSILSFGKMNQFTNRFYGHREFDTKNSNNTKYQAEMDKIRGGWLKKNKDTEDYFLYTRDEPIQKIHTEELKLLYPKYRFNDKPSSWVQNEKLCKAAGEFFPKDESGEYRIFATGKMEDKKHEVLIPIHKKDDRIVKLDSDTVKKFFDVYESSPDFEKFRHLLDEKDKEIPVTYVPGEHGDDGIVAVGMGRMIRYPYKYDVEQLVAKQQPEYQDKRKDLCETIFGWVDKDNCMKGRVQVGNAFATKDIADEDLHEVVKGVLGTPRGSFYPFYILQGDDKYKTYEDDNGISGRKRYRIHSGGSTVELPKGNGNENVGVTFKPIPAGQKFIMRINVHNLKKVEVGALLSAITLHKQSKVWHNIGLAKSFGFGKLHCESLTLRGFNGKEHDYIVTFEREMADFTSKEYQGLSWLNTEQTKYLFGIMSEHKSSELEMMVLKDYTKAKRNEEKKNNQTISIFAQIKNKRLLDKKYESHSVKTQEDLNEEKEKREKEHKEQQEKLREQKRKEREEQFSKEHKAEYDKVKGLENSEDETDLNIAINILKTLISKREQEDPKLDTVADEDWKKRIEKRLKDIQAAKEEDKANQTLAEVLEEKYPNKDEYKVKDLKALVQKAGKWMKEHEMDDTAKATFIRNLTRVKAYDEKKFGKQWKQNEKSVSTILSKEEIDSI